MEEAMKRWTDAAAPGEKHKLLARRVGQWRVTTKAWMAPGAEPMVSESDAVIEAILGGRFIEERVVGQMMGAPYEGRYLFGYDNTRKQFVSVSLNNMGTGLTPAIGGLSADEKTMTLFAQMDEPMTGEVGKPVRFTIRFVDDDTHVFEAHEVTYGEPVRVVEATYRRKK